MFFALILRENRPVTELLTANYTYLNQRLAEHYGIPGIYGSQFRRVMLTDAESRRIAGTRQHPDGDFLSEPHVGRAARQVGAGESAGHAAAAAAARRAGARGAQQGRQDS